MLQEKASFIIIVAVKSMAMSVLKLNVLKNCKKKTTSMVFLCRFARAAC